MNTKSPYSPPSQRRRALAATLLTAMLASTSALAADLTWTGAVNGTWDTSTANWSGTSSTFTSGDNAIFSGSPSNNVTSATGLTIGSINLQSGFTGTVALTGANTVSGGTTISAGTILFSNNSSFGTSAITLNGGTIRNTAGVTTTNDLVVNSGTTTLNVSGSNWNLNGNISGSGAITRGTSATLTLFLGGNNSGYTGTFTSVNNGNSIVRFSSANAGSANAKWIFDNATIRRQTMSFGTGTISFGSMTGIGNVNGDVSGTKTISVGALGLNETFSGLIDNGVGGSVIAITKVGTGTWTLSGNNAYTGATTVKDGTLAIGAANRISDSSALVLDGGTFATGGFSETLGTLTLSSSSTIDFGSGTSALVFSDSSAISWSGTLTLTNFDIGTDSLRFGTSISALTVAQLSEISLAGYTASLDSSGFVTFSAIPEPSTYAAILGLATLGGVLVKRRYRDKRAQA